MQGGAVPGSEFSGVADKDHAVRLRPSSVQCLQSSEFTAIAGACAH